MAAETFTPAPEHVDAVHTWRAIPAEKRIGRPLVPLLRERFGVTALQAIAIIRAANSGRDADATLQ